MGNVEEINIKERKEEEDTASVDNREWGWQQVKHQKVGTACSPIRTDLMKFRTKNFTLIYRKRD